MEKIPILSICNAAIEASTGKPEVEVSYEVLEKLALKYGYDIFFQEEDKITYYWLLMPHYIFYAKVKKQ